VQLTGAMELVFAIGFGRSALARVTGWLSQLILTRQSCCRQSSFFMALEGVAARRNAKPTALWSVCSFQLHSSRSCLWATGACDPAQQEKAVSFARLGLLTLAKARS